MHNVYADLDAREYVFLLEVFDTGISYDYNYRFHRSALCEHTFISLALHWSQIRNILCFCCLWVSVRILNQCQVRMARVTQNGECVCREHITAGVKYLLIINAGTANKA